ncbi:MAG TPA: hypothetical protein VGN54_12640 [Mycobacteriales bacterium]|jgi:hypothetical protein|nr:hypothetical protein [Mycobacteriales bacterium]
MTSSTPHGGRGNGLSATAGWVALGECDPRLADELLGDLALARIAAYAAPSVGAQGGYLERRPPRRPLDQLFVDGVHRQEAQALIRGRLGPPPPPSTPDDAAFAAIVAGFDAPAPAGGWPVSEDIDASAVPPAPADDRPAAPRVVRPAQEPGLLDPGGLLYDSVLGDGQRQRGEDPFAGDDNHYEPPPVEPLPPVHPLTRAAVVAIVAGVLCLLAPIFGLFTDAGVADLVAAALIVGGIATLVARMRDGPRDDDSDDGAVV